MESEKFDTMFFIGIQSPSNVLSMWSNNVAAVTVTKALEYNGAQQLFLTCHKSKTLYNAKNLFIRIRHALIDVHAKEHLLKVPDLTIFSWIVSPSPSRSLYDVVALSMLRDCNVL